MNHVYIRVEQETLYRAVSCISESKLRKYCPVESHTMFNGRDVAYFEPFS